MLGMMRIVALAALASIFATASHSVTVHFAAELTRVSPGLADDVGTTATGTIEYDATVTPYSPWNPALAYQLFEDAGAFHFSTTNATSGTTSNFSATQLDVLFGNNEPPDTSSDRFELRTSLGSGPANNTIFTGLVGGNPVIGGFGLFLQGDNSLFGAGESLSDTDLLDGLSAPYAEFLFATSAGNSRYRITSLFTEEISPVPLPASGATFGFLLACACVVASWRTRRKAV